MTSRGRYELRARMTTEGVVVGKETYNPGAGIRISGAKRSWVVKGTAEDQLVRFPFEVDRDRREVVLILELRGAKGSASFPKDSLQLVRR